MKIYAIGNYIYDKIFIFFNFFLSLGCIWCVCVCFQCLKMPRLTKDQRVRVCLQFARVNNAHEVLTMNKNEKQILLVYLSVSFLFIPNSFGEKH